MFPSLTAKSPAPIRKSSSNFRPTKNAPPARTKIFSAPSTSNRTARSFPTPSRRAASCASYRQRKTRMWQRLKKRNDVKSSKHQAPSSREAPNFKHQAVWMLELGVSLELGAWILGLSKYERFRLHTRSHRSPMLPHQHHPLLREIHSTPHRPGHLRRWHHARRNRPGES